MTSRQIDVLRKIVREKEEKLQKGESCPGVIKLVKVYIAMKRKLSVGDKMRDATVTRASSRAFCPKRTCLTSKMERRWRSS